MTTTTFPPCRLGVTDQMLSDWQDEKLPQTEAERLAAHVPSCPGCRPRTTGFARATAALQRQPIPDLSGRIWRSVREGMTQPRPAHPLGRRGVGVVGAVAATLLVALFVALLAGTHHPGVSGAPTAVVTRTPVATATADPSHPLTPTQAWGTAGQQVIPLDPQKYGTPEVLPDGKGLLTIDDIPSTTHAPRPQPRILLTNPTTGAVQTIFTTTSWDVARVATDGRYIAWWGGFNLTGGPGNSNITVGYLDTQTGHTTLVSNGTNDTLDSTAIYATHGRLILVSNRGTGVHIIDMATGEAQTLLSGLLSVTVSWPYLVADSYASTTPGTTKPSPTDSPPTTLLNLETGQQTDVTHVLDFSYYLPNNIAMDGSTLFVTRANAAKDAVQFIEIDHADQPNPSSRVLFTLPVKNYQDGTLSLVADSRLLLIAHQFSFNGQDAVWDRAQGRLITLPPSPQVTSYSVLLNGMLVYWQQSSTSWATVVRDDTQLPTAPPQ